VSYGSRDMGKRKKATTGAQIREEIRRLNLIAKSEFRRSFDEEAAVDLLLRLGLSEVPEVGISPVIKYRLLVGGVGIAYEGESEAEGRRQLGLFTAESKTARLRSSGEFCNIVQEFRGRKAIPTTRNSETGIRKAFSTSRRRRSPLVLLES
jgi:hypothetical protein